MKKLYKGLIIILSCVTVSTVCLAESININGKQVEVETKTVGDKKFLPVRGVSDNLGLKTKWNDETKTVAIYSSDTEMNISMGSNIAKIITNDVKKSIDMGVKPYLENNTTYLPLRVISETFGYKVSYKDGMVYMDINKKVETETEVKPNEENKEYTDLEYEAYIVAREYLLLTRDGLKNVLSNKATISYTNEMYDIVTPYFDMINGRPDTGYVYGSYSCYLEKQLYDTMSDGLRLISKMVDYPDQFKPHVEKQIQNIDDIIKKFE